MEYLVEEITLERLCRLLDQYNKENDIAVDYTLLKMLNKGTIELYEHYVKGSMLKFVVEKISTFGSISAYDIKGVFPLESSYSFSYILNNTNIDKSTKIKVFICDKSNLESSFYTNALNTAININLTFDNNNISPAAMDEYYEVKKNFAANAKKTFFGTMLGIRSSGYFQSKNNTGDMLDIKELEGKYKNYLKPKVNEQLIIYCPICEEKKKFVYSEINDIFSITKDTVTVVCLHSKSKHMYEKAPHKIRIEQEILEEIKKDKYTNEDIFMWIINNRKYFELFRK